ncbi:MAG: hypothetical protein GWO07_10445 [Candidatus Dadabacteria bacterium]|nr:hypothetical protein [Candidatus Dadabacteria bacterium]NIS09163.1 hypothetical protein [Candidatus Dadabacteria bacterium]NIY22470.1 hypothetical protein [Candidatus Dadabacteria bacterium]
MRKKHMPALIKENNIDIDEFPPVLRKLAEKVMGNYNFNSLQELCNNEGMSYRSVLNAISREKKKGNDFRMLLYSLLDYRNKCLLPFVDNVVYGKALESDMTAAKLFYKRTGAIQSGSGGDRVQVNNQINLAFTPPLPDKDTIDI